MTAQPGDDLISLIEAALSGLDDEQEDREGPATGWRAVSLLRGRGDPATLAAAIGLCGSTEEKRRRLGAAILGQLGNSCDAPGGVFREERYQALEALLLIEMGTTARPDVLGDVCVALGHLDDDRAIAIALKLAGHEDAEVRFGVVMALSGHDDEAAISGLIALSSDSEDDVRDWAAFSLGQQIETDTDAIRAALHARVTDSNPDVRVEAIAGLARRKDRTVTLALINELSIALATPLFDAACDLADPALCEVLLAARDIGAPWDSVTRESWQDALAACGCTAPGN